MNFSHVFPRFVTDYVLLGPNGGIVPAVGNQVYDFSTLKQATDLGMLASAFLESVKVSDEILSGDWAGRLVYNSTDENAPKVYTVTGEIRRPGVVTDANPNPADILLAQSINVGRMLQAYRTKSMRPTDVPFGDVLTYSMLKPTTADFDGQAVVFWANRVVTIPWAR